MLVINAKHLERASNWVCSSGSYSYEVCGAGASGELNMNNLNSEIQGGLYTSQAAESYLRFPPQLHPAQIGYHVRLKLCAPKLYADVM